MENKMKEVHLSNFQENIYNIINTVINSRQPILISDKGKTLVKIVPFTQRETGSWLGSMRGTGKIIGDIISPAENSHVWEVLSP